MTPEVTKTVLNYVPLYCFTLSRGDENCQLFIVRISQIILKIINSIDNNIAYFKINCLQNVLHHLVFLHNSTLVLYHFFSSFKFF
jgi:hypothetical protein